MSIQILREGGASRSENRRARPHPLLSFSYSTVVISREVRRIKCCRLLISHQQNRYVPVAKELFRSIQRLLSCCYNEEIALPMPTDPFNECFRLSSSGRGFDAQSGRCSQELCFILKRVGAFHFFACSFPRQWLLYLLVNALECEQVLPSNMSICPQS